MIARPTKKVKNLLVLTDLQKIFETFDELDDALDEGLSSGSAWFAKRNGRRMAKRPGGRS